MTETGASCGYRVFHSPPIDGLLVAVEVRQASELAGQQIDKLADASATDEERQQRKRRLLKGPRKFRDIRGDSPQVEGLIPVAKTRRARRVPPRTRRRLPYASRRFLVWSNLFPLA
jgi:hypothetical protein